MEKYALWLNGVKNAEGIDKVKAENAAKVYRKLFDEYFEAVNDFLVSHGMQPIGRIEGYTPHIPLEEKFTLVGKALDKLGISEWLDRDEKTGTIPAEIAGRTEFFRPQKRWNPFFLSRKGDKTEYDIRKAFQSYVTYLGDVLYHTDDIQKLRGLESYLRAGTSGAVDAELEEAYQVASSRLSICQEVMRSFFLSPLHKNTHFKAPVKGKTSVLPHALDSCFEMCSQYTRT